MTLNEWINNSPEVKLLESNIKTNIEVITELVGEDVDELVRLHMIMIRQFTQNLVDKNHKLEIALKKAGECGHGRLAHEILRLEEANEKLLNDVKEINEVCEDGIKGLAVLGSRVNKLKKALEFYADTDNWHVSVMEYKNLIEPSDVHDLILPRGFNEITYHVGGKRARETLKEIEDDEKLS